MGNTRNSYAASRQQAPSVQKHNKACIPWEICVHVQKITHSFNLNTLGPNVQTLSFTFFFLTSPSWLYIRAVHGAGWRATRAPQHSRHKTRGKKKSNKESLKIIERPFLLHTAENIHVCLVYASWTHQSQCETFDEGLIKENRFWR